MSATKGIDRTDSPFSILHAQTSSLRNEGFLQKRGNGGFYRTSNRIVRLQGTVLMYTGEGDINFRHIRGALSMDKDTAIFVPQYEFKGMEFPIVVLCSPRNSPGLILKNKNASSHLSCIVDISPSLLSTLFDKAPHPKYLFGAYDSSDQSAWGHHLTAAALSASVASDIRCVEPFSYEDVLLAQTRINELREKLTQEEENCRTLKNELYHTKRQLQITKINCEVAEPLVCEYFMNFIKQHADAVARDEASPQLPFKSSPSSLFLATLHNDTSAESNTSASTYTEITTATDSEHYESAVTEGGYPGYFAKSQSSAKLAATKRQKNFRDTKLVKCT